MDTEHLLEDLGITASTEISDATSIISRHVKKMIQRVQEFPSEERAEKEEKDIETTLHLYFNFVRKWVSEKRLELKHKKDHANAQKLRDKAHKILQEVHHNLVGFSICYMCLNRCVGFVDIALQTTEKPEEKATKWTSDTGVLIGRFRKERAALYESNEKLAKAFVALKQSDSLFQDIEKAAKKIFSDQITEDFLRSFRSQLRTTSFDKARSLLKKLNTEKTKFMVDGKTVSQNIKAIQDAGTKIIEILNSNLDSVSSADSKLYLSASEAQVMIEAQMREIQQKSKFIRKYYRPYLENKRRSFSLFKDKLFVIGSIESLMTLYLRMMRGYGEPMVSEAEVREYESKVLDHIDYLLCGPFQEVDKINSWADAEMKDFREAISDFNRPD